jgi:hypothetical protein
MDPDVRPRRSLLSFRRQARRVVPLLALLGGTGHAQPYLDASGRSWKASPRDGGMELGTPGVRFVLLPSCVARSALLGEGRWSWANGGFRVQFASAVFLFPRQSAPLEDLEGRCRL